MRSVGNHVLMSAVAGTAMIVFSVSASATVPSLVNYQGILADGSDTPQVGTFSITFSIYDDASATNPALWSETQSVTTDAQGRFNVLLGSMTTLTEAVFSGADRWLGTKVSPEVSDLLPRTRIATVAYAFRPATVDGASGGNITSKISIGPGHTNPGADAFVAGNANMAVGDMSTVAGGFQNETNGPLTAVAGGRGNAAQDSGAAVGGGFNNAAITKRSFVGGGWNNVTNAPHAAIGGGQTNFAGGQHAFIGGGRNNVAGSPALYATIGGGDQNLANGSYSFIGGGKSNTAGSEYAVVVGGQDNVADGSNSFAAGYRAKALHYGSFVWGDLQIGAEVMSDTYNQFKIRAENGVRFASAAGSSKVIALGDHYRDNGIIAWAKVTGSTGATSGNEFGVATVSRTGPGDYSITVDASAAAAATLIPVAITEVEAVPTSAANARLIYVNQTGTGSTFDVYITNGNYVATDNDFVFIVTAR